MSFQLVSSVWTNRRPSSCKATIPRSWAAAGRGGAASHDGRDHDGERHYFLAPGERYDLKARRRRNPDWLDAAAGPLSSRRKTDHLPRSK